MSIFIDPTGQPTYGIAICGRCSRKFPIADLSPDPNSPGLMVCAEDLDMLDPYRLPARQTEQINLPFTRPDVPLTEGGPIPDEIGLFGVREDQGGDGLRVTEEGLIRTINDDELLEPI